MTRHRAASPRLLGLGSALLDQLAHVPESFLETVPGRKGGTELVDFPTISGLLARLPQPPVRAPGGSAANTVVGAARLGLPAGMLAKIGADADGRFYRSSLEDAGVATSPFKTDPRIPTGRCLSLITPDSQRTMRTYLGAAAHLSPDEITSADFAEYSHLHLEGYQLFNRELMTRILKTAKAAGCRISLDLSAPEVVMASRDILADLLHDYVAAVFANEDEASVFADGRGEDAGLEALAAVCPLAVVKLGVRGSVIRCQGATVKVPAHVVKASDTTGAGDLWAAGFLYGWLNGADLATAGDFGARAAAAVVQVTGAVIPEAEWARLRRECTVASGA